MSADRLPPPSEGERELARVLALLKADPAGSLTIAALRERGIKAPAQAVYDLQLAGYPIDRVSRTDPGGRRSVGYRLHVSHAPAAETAAASRAVDRDGRLNRSARARSSG